MPVPNSPNWVLQPNSLLSVQTLKDELGIANATATFDNRLTRFINAASDAIEAYCARALALQKVTEFYSQVASRMVWLNLKRVPVLGVYQVLSDPVAGGGVFTTGSGTLVDPTEYQLDDVANGCLYMSTRWFTTAVRRPDISQDYDPGTEQNQYQVDYVAGYVTQPMVDALNQAAGGTWGTLAWGTWTANTKYDYGCLVTPVGQSPAQVWRAISTVAVTGTTTPTPAAGVSSGAQPAWPGSPAVGATIVDGTVTWSYVGTWALQTTTGRTIPSEVEQACLTTATTWYKRTQRGGDVVSEHLSEASRVYVGGPVGPGALPHSVKEILAPYRRVL